MNTENVKGFRDIEGECAERRVIIRNMLEETFRKYCFIPVETPIIEYEEFVKSNNPNDEAVSNIFKLEDRGKRKLALRYEFTFQLKRLAQNKKLPFKRYQIGPVFRDEPIGGNRWRQFTQCDIDVIGSTIKDEAEILQIIFEIFNKLKIKFTINLNNKKLLNEILDELKIKEENKEQVIREIDKLNKLSEEEVIENLKKYNAEKALTIFKKPEKYFEKYKAYSEIAELRKICSAYKIKFNFVSFLARGLSYYNGTIFEVKSDIKETLAGGGSYLVNGIQSKGISFGLDRIELLAKIDSPNKKTLLISINQDKKAIELAEKLRKNNIPCTIMYEKISKALEYADSYKIPYVIFLGEEEAKKKKVKIRNMASGKEELISEEDLLKRL